VSAWRATPAGGSAWLIGEGTIIE